MFEIIIIFIIVSVIGNILKAIGQAGRRGTTHRPFPKSTIDNQIKRAGDKTADIKRYSTGKSVEIKDKMEDTGTQTDFFSESQPAYTSYDSDIQRYTNTKRFSEHQRKLFFSKDSLINGIILSEILLPPKSRRRG